MIANVVERCTVVSLIGAVGVPAPVTMLTVQELDLDLDLVPTLLRLVMVTHALGARLIGEAVTINVVSYV